MSYCRWSRTCDVYAYEAIPDGWMPEVPIEPDDRRWEIDVGLDPRWTVHSLRAFRFLMVGLALAGWRYPIEVIHRIDLEIAAELAGDAADVPPACPLCGAHWGHRVYCSRVWPR